MVFSAYLRVLIVYFKRYGMNSDMKIGKREDDVTIPKYLTLQGHCISEIDGIKPVPPPVK